MNIIKSAIAGAATAVGTHFGDEALNMRPMDSKVYYGVAGVAVVGAYFLRKSPIALGALLGVAAGSAYQGYTRTSTLGATMGPQFVTQAPKTNPYIYFTTPTDVYPVAPAPSAPRPATGPTIGGKPVDQWLGYGQEGLDFGKKAYDNFGGGWDAPTPYTQEQYDADTQSFNE